MLPSIFKIIEQKIKYLLTLKNIRNANSVQFYQWISILKYWQRFFDYLIDQHSLINFSPKPNPNTRPLIAELTEVVNQNLRKAIATMNLKSLLLDLTVDYLNVFHNVTTSQYRIPQTTKLSTPFKKTPGSPLRSLRNSQKSSTTSSTPKAQSSMLPSPSLTPPQPLPK